MKHTPINFQNLDLQSEGQHCNTTTTTRPIPLIYNYIAYYLDPDFGIDPYWDIQIYNQHHILFYNNFTKNITDIELDSPGIDQNLNTHLSTAFLRLQQTEELTHKLNHLLHH